MRVFSIYDSKADVYSKPVCEVNAGVALRGFSDFAKGRDGKNPISEHPEDYTLFEIGTWDAESGAVTMFEAHHSLGCAIEFVEERPDNYNEPEYQKSLKALKGAA